MKMEALLNRLSGTRRSGDGWIALCPAHADKNPSLSVDVRDGTILVHCHAGCSQEAVLAALRVNAHELFLNAGERKIPIIAEYPYLDEKGELLFEVVRLEPKSFRQRRLDGQGKWKWNVNGTRRVLYRLPEVLTAESVLVCEGEKDCETARKLGLVATCNSGGAGKWKEEYSETLCGKCVCIIADADEVGRKHAQQVAESLYLRAKSVKILELSAAKDLSEWVENGGTKEVLSDLMSNTPEWREPKQQNIGFCGLALVMADEFLKRPSQDEKPWLAKGLLPCSSQTIWQGRPKVGKSHSLLQLAFDLACGLPVFGHFHVERPVRCAYLELEEPEAVTKARYAAMLRAHDGEGPDSNDLRFFTREDLHRLGLLPRELLSTRLKDFVAALRDAGSELVVLIALRRFLGSGENLKDSEVAERVNDALDTILSETGAAIVLANHNRKQGADTVEAQGFGSTFISARADGTFDLERAQDSLRRVRCEARFNAPEQFFLHLETVGDGEVIHWSEAPIDPKRNKREDLLRRIAAGETVRRAAAALEISYSTAKRWAHGAEEVNTDGSQAH
jgi:putative DNA primase/helicase